MFLCRILAQKQFMPWDMIAQIGMADLQRSLAAVLISWFLGHQSHNIVVLLFMPLKAFFVIPLYIIAAILTLLLIIRW